MTKGIKIKHEYEVNCECLDDLPERVQIELLEWLREDFESHGIPFFCTPRIDGRVKIVTEKEFVDLGSFDLFENARFLIEYAHEYKKDEVVHKLNKEILRIEAVMKKGQSVIGELRQKILEYK